MKVPAIHKKITIKKVSKIIYRKWIEKNPSEYRNNLINVSASKYAI